MLTNLLPGFRELRAPLAAGYLWLAAAWVLWTPTCEDSELTMSACRLDSLVSGLGFAAVASFAAYLLGALSIAFCSLPLRRWLQGGGVQRAERLRSVSARADRYLRRVATEGVERMTLALAFSETSVTDVLDDVLEQAPLPSRWRWRAPREVRSPAVLSADSPAPPPQDQVDRDRLVDAMARELDEIVLTRLLGRDPEFFSAIDRRRAEVEFRLAVIPPLLVVLAAVAASVPPVAAMALLAGAVLFAAGLGWDALTSQRRANDELVVALSDGRISSPSLARAEAEATARAERSRLDEMRAAAGHATNAMRTAILRAEEIDSAPSRTQAAREAVRDAQGYLTRVESTFPAAVSELGARAVEATDRAVQLWESPDGRGESHDWAAESRRLVGESKRHASDFRDALLDELERVKSSARSED